MRCTESKERSLGRVCTGRVPVPSSCSPVHTCSFQRTPDPNVVHTIVKRYRDNRFRSVFRLRSQSQSPVTVQWISRTYVPTHLVTQVVMYDGVIGLGSLPKEPVTT